MATISLTIQRGIGERLLYIKYNHEGKHVTFSTGISALESEYNFVLRKGRRQIDKTDPFKHSKPGYTSLRKRLIENIGLVEKAVEVAEAGGSLEVSDVKAAYLGKTKGETLYDAVGDIIEILQVKESTKKGYRSFHKIIAHFKDVRLMHLDQAFYDRFVRWLNDEGYSLIYQDTCIKNLKAVCNKLVVRGYNVNPYFRYYGRIKSPIDKVYLSQDEVKAFAEFDDLEDWQKRTRDLFVLHCNLGLRVSDFTRITKGWVNGRVLTVPAQKKTEKPVTIPLNDVAINLLEKYDYQMPFLTDPAYNRQLKIVCEAAGLNRSVECRGKVQRLCDVISTKAAKKTFVTYAIQMGLTPDEIEVITGTSAIIIRKNYAGELGIKAIAEKMNVAI
ncbi:MAG: tyrosine-type recombinase/integrase [Lewinella sp.]|uniref:tyrosine-type recombinase/integrase n=1 Tax=Lewinella sp. TaxID=2004506 RepID=UPI003D6A0BDA